MTDSPPAGQPDPTAPLAASLAFLLGDWEGEGVGGAPDADDFAFAQETSFSDAGGGAVAYSTRVWSIETGDPVTRESGFWRLLPDRTVEMVIAHDGGYVEVSLGTLAFTRVEARSDLVARTDSGDDVAAVQRLYGMVGDELMYAVDMGPRGGALTPRLSGRLRRVG